MPTYEYECTECSHSFEVFQSMSDEPLKKCPQCGKGLRRLIFGGAGVIFKGSGFYVTDKAAGNKKGGGVSVSGDGSKKESTKPPSTEKDSKEAVAPAVASGTDGSGKAANSGQAGDKTQPKTA
jgi:putative FmdB family regulatory protein